MIDAAYIFVLLFLAVFAEVHAASWFVLAPFTALVVFYLSMLYGWHTGAILGFVSGFVFDSLMGRNFPVSAFSTAAVPAITVFWLFRGETKAFLLHMIPGAMTGLLSSLPVVLMYGFKPETVLMSAGQILSAVAAGMLILPPMIFMLDAAAEKLGMELYRKAKEDIAGKL